MVVPFDFLRVKLRVATERKTGRFSAEKRQTCDMIRMIFEYTVTKRMMRHDFTKEILNKRYVVSDRFIRIFQIYLEKLPMHGSYRINIDRNGFR